MYTLYSLAGTCSTGITILLTKLGAEFEVIQRDDVSNYQEIVPTNQVPALKTEDGQIITEGAAIALYLLEKHANDMLPKDMADKADFLRWLMFNYATLHPAYSKVFATRSITDGQSYQVELMQKMADNLSKSWKIVDDRLANQKYMVGDTPTIIDDLLAIYTSWNNYFPQVDVTVGKNVERLVQDIIEQPAFQKAYALENKEFKQAA